MLQMSKRKHRFLLLLLLPAGGCGLFYSLNRAFPFPAACLAEAQTGGATCILDAEGGCMAWRVDKKENWRFPVSLDAVSPWVIRATLAAEDKRFWQHSGVDPLAAGRAFSQNLWYRRRISGASTISMQTIRLLTPRQRTYPVKLLEAFRALQLENLNAKRNILQLYLNLAPYGGNLVGIEAASQRLFGKQASALSLAEASLLAGLPQSPTRFDPRRHLTAARKRQSFVLDRMLALKLAPPGAIARARQEPIRLRPPRALNSAPGAADLVLRRVHHQGGHLSTTITPGTQEVLEELVLTYGKELGCMGIDGLAAVIIDVKASALVAAVGNANPLDRQTGQINGLTRPRQAGSLLKPFLYGLAFEQGLLTPGSLVYDIPTRWSGYRPNNMDHRFLGPIPASTALQRSRNIPAVRLLDRLSVESLHTRLQQLALNTGQPATAYGLSLALGTPEFSLPDLANAYACISRGGIFRPLRLLDTDRAPACPVFTPGAAWLTLRALGASEGGAPYKPVWKTGTSWNHRDAWAIALSPDHVVAVWCGRMNGGQHTFLTGAEAALPLALSVLNRITSVGASNWRRPEGIDARKVCALTGAPPSLACPDTVIAEWCPGTSHDTPCTLHRKDKNRTAVIWPAEVQLWQASKERQPVPTLQIRSPTPCGEYLMAAGSTVLPLRAQQVGCEEQPIHWILNGRHLATGLNFNWVMQPGRHTLIAASEQGLTAKVTFRVLPEREMP